LLGQMTDEDDLTSVLARFTESKELENPWLPCA